MKVFGAGRFAATGLPDTDEEGIVCFITVAGFLNGPGFEKMRDDLRRTCSDIWVIDCSPEGHQPDVPTRIFQGVQQPVCIVLAARKLGKDEKTRRTCGFARCRKAGGRKSSSRLPRCRSTRRTGSIVQRTGARPSCRSMLESGQILRRCAVCSIGPARR